MIERIGDARIIVPRHRHVVGRGGSCCGCGGGGTFGAVLFVELDEQLLEVTMIAIEELHLLVVTHQLGDAHDRVRQRVLVLALLGKADVIHLGYVALANAATAQGALQAARGAQIAARRLEQHDHAIVEQTSPFVVNCQMQIILFETRNKATIFCKQVQPNNSNQFIAVSLVFSMND